MKKQTTQNLTTFDWSSQPEDLQRQKKFYSSLGNNLTTEKLEEMNNKYAKLIKENKHQGITHTEDDYKFNVFDKNEELDHDPEEDLLKANLEEWHYDPWSENEHIST